MFTSYKSIKRHRRPYLYLLVLILIVWTFFAVVGIDANTKMVEKKIDISNI